MKRINAAAKTHPFYVSSSSNKCVQMDGLLNIFCLGSVNFFTLRDQTSRLRC